MRAPDLARVTILASHTLVDMAIPLDVPIALVLPSVVDMIRDKSRDNAFDDSGERFEPADWALARVGQPPLSNSSSLRDQEVRDGELLMVTSAVRAAPAPLFDDIMYNVAIADADHFRAWDPKLARITGSALAVVAVLVGCLGLLVKPHSISGWISGPIALAAAIGLVIGSIVLRRVYDDAGTALVLGAAALPMAGTAGVLFVPGAYGWAQVLLAATLVGATAVLTWRITGVGAGLFVGVTAVAVYLVPAALVGLLTNVPLRTIGGGLVALGLGGLSVATWVSMRLATLPLPPVPTPGTAIDPTEDDPDDHRALPSLEVLQAKAQRARWHLQGLVAATTIVTALGALAATDPGASGPYWPGVALALVSAVVLLFRSRTYAGAQQAVVLLSGGTCLLLILVAGVGIETGIPLAGFGIAVVIATAALVLGTIVAGYSATPPMRKAVELVEYGFIAAVLPLTFWVTSLFTLVRQL